MTAKVYLTKRHDTFFISQAEKRRKVIYQEEHAVLRIKEACLCKSSRGETFRIVSIGHADNFQIREN